MALRRSRPVEADDPVDDDGDADPATADPVADAAQRHLTLAAALLDVVDVDTVLDLLMQAAVPSLADSCELVLEAADNDGGAATLRIPREGAPAIVFGLHEPAT